MCVPRHFLDVTCCCMHGLSRVFGVAPCRGGHVTLSDFSVIFKSGCFPLRQILLIRGTTLWSYLFHVALIFLCIADFFVLVIPSRPGHQAMGALFLSRVVSPSRA
jgi:hypothetical protein